MDQAERRKNRRFLLRQPATLRYHDGAMRELKADTLNASLKGMLLTAEQGLPSGVELEVTLTLQKGGLQGIALHATGRVVRQQARSAGKSAIAIAFQGRLS
ncbi:MAG: PilZ domain-containing protein [Terriglobales bacterium]